LPLNALGEYAYPLVFHSLWSTSANLDTISPLLPKKLSVLISSLNYPVMKYSRKGAILLRHWIAEFI
jgi:hypothetical protein